MKKSPLVGKAGVSGEPLSSLGCESAADGVAGGPGLAEPERISGPLSTLLINLALKSKKPLVFENVIQSDAGMVVIQAYKRVWLEGPVAYTTYGSADSMLIIEDESSVMNIGRLKAGPGSAIVVPEALARIVTDTTPVLIKRLNANTDFSASVAVIGPVTISNRATSENNINAASLKATTKLYVAGSLEVNSRLPNGALVIAATRDVTVSKEDQNMSINWYIYGNFVAIKNPIADRTNLKVYNRAEFWEVTIPVSSNIYIFEDAQFKEKFKMIGGTVNVDIGATFHRKFESFGGKVRIAASATFRDTVLDVGGEIEIGNNATFGKTLEILGSTGELAVGGDLNVTGNALLGGAGAKLSGNVNVNGDIIIDKNTITLADGKTLTLKSGKSVKMGNAQSSATVLTANDGDVTFKTGGETKLTAMTNMITVSKADLAVTSGQLVVAGNAALSVDNKDLIVNPNASLVLTGSAPGAKLACSGKGRVVAGKTVISGSLHALPEASVKIEVLTTGEI
jgi:hypothetical protein